MKNCLNCVHAKKDETTDTYLCHRYPPAWIMIADREHGLIPKCVMPTLFLPEQTVCGEHKSGSWITR